MSPIVSGFSISIPWVCYVPAFAHPPKFARSGLSGDSESLIQMASQHTQHIQKALDQMNLQIHHVLSEITGWSDVSPAGSHRSFGHGGC
jgi:hypothetical protein